MGRMLLHTVRFRQCAEAGQTCKSWEYGDSTLESGRQLVQEIVPSVPTGNDRHHHQLVHHATGGIRDRKTDRCLLDVLDLACEERIMVGCDWGFGKGDTDHMVLLAEQSL